MTNIQPLIVKPATHVEKYDGYTIIITYDVSTGKWKWVASKPVKTEIRYEGIAKGKGDAAGAAKRKIDGG